MLRHHMAYHTRTDRAKHTRRRQATLTRLGGIKGIGHVLRSRVRRTRRPGGKGVIEKVPETFVKGSTVKEAAKADKHEHNV